MLKARDLRHAYGNRQILTGVDLKLSPGEVMGVGGPSGSGKTTLCRILAGRSVPGHGEVLLDGARLETARPGLPAPVQYAPQSPELAVDPRWPVRKVLENGMVPDPEVLAALGIRDAWLNRRPTQLSGGELARGVARLSRPLELEAEWSAATMLRSGLGFFVLVVLLFLLGCRHSVTSMDR